MTVYIKEEEKAYTVIARDKAPAAATEDMFHGNYDKATKGKKTIIIIKGIVAQKMVLGSIPTRRT